MSERISDESLEWRVSEFSENEPEYQMAKELQELRRVLPEIREALQCNETFHRLGGLDDCEPCKAKKLLDSVMEKK